MKLQCAPTPTRGQGTVSVRDVHRNPGRFSIHGNSDQLASSSVVAQLVRVSAEDQTGNGDDHPEHHGGESRVIVVGSSVARLRGNVTSSGVHRAAASHHIRSEALRDPCRRCFNRVLREVGIASGRLHLSVTEKLPDHREALAQCQCPGGETMPQIMKTYIVQASTSPYDEPRSVEVGKPRTGLSTGNHPWGVRPTRNRGQNPHRGWRQRDPPSPRLSIKRSGSTHRTWRRRPRMLTKS